MKNGSLTNTPAKIQARAIRRRWIYERVSDRTIKLTPPTNQPSTMWINVFLGQSDERVTRAYLMRHEGEVITATRIFGGAKAIAAIMRKMNKSERNEH